MQPTYKDLPDELLIHHITPYFLKKSPELSSLSLTSKKFYQLFQTNRMVGMLLSYVACGNQDAAEKMLKKNPKLLLERGSVIDFSGRHFTRISAFELVLWNMDVRYMGGMILESIPKNKEGKNIREQLLKQYQQLKDKGVTYTLNNQRVTESHFSYQPLINTLDNYIKNFSKWSPYKIVTYLCEEIGKEQNRLTIEGRNQYCHLTRSFDPTPEFNEKHLQRNLKFYLKTRGFIKELVWDSSLTGLGIDFAAARDRERFVFSVMSMELSQAQQEHAAISRLSEVRKKDLESLIERLEQSIQQSEVIQTSCCAIS